VNGLKTEFTKWLTLEEYFHYNESIGMTVEINDGQITGINFEEE
jgi:hypothetical protein